MCGFSGTPVLIIHGIHRDQLVVRLQHDEEGRVRCLRQLQRERSQGQTLAHLVEFEVAYEDVR